MYYLRELRGKAAKIRERATPLARERHHPDQCRRCSLALHQEIVIIPWWRSGCRSWCARSSVRAPSAPASRWRTPSCPTTHPRVRNCRRGSAVSAVRSSSSGTERLARPRRRSLPAASRALWVGGTVAQQHRDDLVKRVIGVGGDHVRCCSTDGRIVLNGVPLTEPYIKAG